MAGTSSGIIPLNVSSPSWKFMALLAVALLILFTIGVLNFIAKVSIQQPLIGYWSAESDAQMLELHSDGTLMMIAGKIFKYKKHQYSVYIIPTEQGDREAVIYKRGRTHNIYLDIHTLEEFIWTGSWSKLTRVLIFQEFTYRIADNSHLYIESSTGEALEDVDLDIRGMVKFDVSGDFLGLT